MTIARVFAPENRLRPVLLDQKAPTAADLVAAAERNVAMLKPGLRASVDRHLAELMQLAGAPEEEVFANCEAVGKAALGVTELAAACDMAAVGEVAQGVYAMVMALRTAGLWHTDALNAHINALMLFTSSPSPSAAETRQILERLASMRAFVGVPT